MMHEWTGIEVDWGAFDPWKVQPVHHGLATHPLLQLGSLVALGRRLERLRSVRTHSNQVSAGTPFNHAPRLHPNDAGAAATLADIAHAKAWMSLLNVQADPTYRTLVDDVLNAVAAQIARRDPGLCYRGGWIFLTSPHTVTPFHFDKEHNFILQLQGHKTIYVWDPQDTEAASEAARDLFHATHSRDRLEWREALRERAHVFHVEPGMGVYMPSTSPHLVETSDGPSVTMSFTYYTDATRRDAVLHRAHERLRQWGHEPPPVGANAALDAALLAAFRSSAWLRQLASRLTGATTPAPDRTPYALAPYERLVA